MKTSIILFVLLLPIVSAATIPAPGEQLRNEQLGTLIQQQGEQCRDYMTEFGRETNEQFEIQKAIVINEVDYELRKLKFTLGITIFASFSAALWLFEIVSRRRFKQYKALTESLAKQAQEQNQPRSPHAEERS